MKTKYLLLLLAIFVLSLNTSSAFSNRMKEIIPGDTTYVFTYDDSGNRTERVIDLTKSGKIPTGSSLSSEDFFNDEIADFNIKIYPNPTKGRLKIEIPDLQDNNARLMVFNNQGQLIKEINVNSNFSEINLSSHPSGMYILKILIGQNSSEWKIIKD